MFQSKNMNHYIFALVLIVGASYVGNKFKNYFVENKEVEYDMIKEYLLNDSPLYGFNKPKLWIHSKYELNARKWLDFQSRNNNNLNQPYIHLTIQSIIDHCSHSFHICLIDDETFSKLIPGWDIQLSTLADPMKSNLRTIGLMKIMHIYGGMVVPDSFLCTKNLLELYEENIASTKPFMCESLNRSVSMNDKKRPVFVPDFYFMGSVKRDPTLGLIIDCLIENNQNGHFTNECKFIGESQRKCMDLINDGKVNIVDGKAIGIKTVKNQPILLEDLVEEKYLDIAGDSVGIYIPRDEILVRTKYQWFAVLSKAELLQSNMAIVKYIKASQVDASEHVNNTMKSVTSI